MVQKKFKGWPKDQSGTIGKKIFRNIFVWVQNDCFDKSLFDGFKAIWSLVKNFQNCLKKSLRGYHRTREGTIGKIFFRNMFLWGQNHCFDEKKRFWLF